MVNPENRFAVFLDIDGTLISDSFRIPQENLDAIAAARAKGHMVFINTGRSSVFLDENPSLSNVRRCFSFPHPAVPSISITPITIIKMICVFFMFSPQFMQGCHDLRLRLTFPAHCHHLLQDRQGMCKECL